MSLPALDQLTPVTTQRGGDPELFHTECLDTIKAAITNTPRSRQKRIGPSEIGHPCTRRLGYKLAGVEPVNDRPSWRPTVGTAVHAWLADTFARANAAPALAGQLRWLVELTVDVGEVAGDPITGSCDVYDRVTATVNDWKVVSTTSLRKYRASGPGPQYRVQAHLYARGLIRRGLPVDTVAITFLPNSGELSEAVFWSEPYDERVALDALDRLAPVRLLADDLGAAVATILPTTGADKDWCRYCPFYLPASTDLAVACPGAA